MDLSIIIPVYDVEDYISECLESVRGLSSIQYEVLVIDDGSRDRSLEMVNDFQKILPQLRILTQPNSGAAVARNRGLNEAKGDFIFFLDSDDFVLSKDFLALFRKAHNEDLDITTGAGKTFYPEGKLTNVKKDSYRRTLGVLSGPRMYDLMVKKKEYSSMIWLSFFKRKFLLENKIMFPENIIHEDEEFTAKAFSKASRVAFYPIDFYRYRYREGSVSKSKNDKHANPRSIPAFKKIIENFMEDDSYSARLTVFRMLLEILKRFEYQKKNNLIKKIPTWSDLGLEDAHSSLPRKLKLKLLRYRLKLKLTA